MNPKPFMSFTSVILPVPCLEKWASISALVAIQASFCVSGRLYVNAQAVARDP